MVFACGCSQAPQGVARCRSSGGGGGEFTVKDEDLAPIVVADLAKIMLPEAR